MTRRFQICRVAALMLVLLPLAVSLLAQQPDVEARIAGLEQNEEYMSLLRRDAQLQEREDSIVRAVAQMRRSLRDDPANGAQYAQEILRLEGSVFDVRNAKGRLIDRINAIEQEWVLAHLDTPVPAAPEPGAGVSIPDSLKVRNLIYNRYFRENLAPEDYAALRRAQRMEPHAEQAVSRYLSYYDTVSELAESYAAAHSEAEAMEIYDRVTQLQGRSRVLADSLSLMWNYIYDNKSYAYAYVLDRLGCEELLVRNEELSARAAREMTELRGTTASDAVADYFVRKHVLLDCELQVARVLELTEAADSLQAASAFLDRIDYRRPPLHVAERYFLAYDSVAFSPTPKYSYQHPIPECKVYANGTIYRILLGTFNTKRAAATFRGAYPLYYLVNDAGKWCYYTGGFATYDEAEAARKRLKEHGFIRPEVVVWIDGAYRNLSQEPDSAPMLYRVEITGTDQLSEAVKQEIARLAGNAELSRAGQHFVIGTFGERSQAERVAEGVRAADGSLEIKVAEIAE